MAEVRNCKRCRKIVMYTSGPQLCDACKTLEEEEFAKVRKFVRDFPGATVQEVSDVTEVPQSTIHKFLKDGKLEVSADSPIAIQCENCGARIRSGRFCATCTTSLARDMMSAGKSLIQDKQSPSSTKSHKDEGGLRHIRRDS